MPAVLAAVLAGVGAAKQVTEAITTVGRALDGARNVVLIVENHTDHALELVREHHDHGGWAVTPTDGVPARQTLVCGSKDRGFMTGTTGEVEYRIRDGRDDDTYVLLTWSNPFVGKNKGAGSAYTHGPELPFSDQHIPLPSARYRVTTVVGAGDREVEIRYSLRRR